jgi:HlyD family secretion protein
VKKDIYRKVALARLQSPEQLDLVMEVTAPKGWIALASIGVLLAVLVVWGVFGSIPEKVDASGILLVRGGIFHLDAPAGGQVAEVTVKEGDTVTRGQVVARIAQPDLVKQISNARAQVEELEAQLAQQRLFAARDATLRIETAGMQRHRLRESLRFLEQREKATKEQLDNSQQLLDKGLLTKSSVLQVQDSYHRTQEQAQSVRGELRQIEVTELALKADRDRSESGIRLRVNESRRQLQLYEKQLDRASVVVTPFAGRVLEMKQDPGSLVGAGTPIMSVQASDQTSEGLQAVVYVAPTKGKSVRPGMVAQVSPTTSKREEYGYVIGKVGLVSEFPSTREGMLRVLPNPDLVASLSGQGAPFAVYVDLVPDGATTSGYRWSSTKGRTQKVGSGTLCQVTIVIRERRPIEMVIPLFREYTGF